MLIQIQTIKASNLASRAIVNESLSLRFFSCIPLSIRVTRNRSLVFNSFTYLNKLTSIVCLPTGPTLITRSMGKHHKVVKTAAESISHHSPKPTSHITPTPTTNEPHPTEGQSTDLLPSKSTPIPSNSQPGYKAPIHPLQDGHNKAQIAFDNSSKTTPSVSSENQQVMYTKKFVEPSNVFTDNSTNQSSPLNNVPLSTPTNPLTFNKFTPTKPVGNNTPIEQAATASVSHTQNITQPTNGSTIDVDYDIPTPPPLPPLSKFNHPRNSTSFQQELNNAVLARKERETEIQDKLTALDNQPDTDSSLLGKLWGYLSANTTSSSPQVNASSAPQVVIQGNAALPIPTAPPLPPLPISKFKSSSAFTEQIKLESPQEGNLKPSEIKGKFKHIIPENTKITVTLNSTEITGEALLLEMKARGLVKDNTDKKVVTFKTESGEDITLGGSLYKFSQLGQAYVEQMDKPKAFITNTSDTSGEEDRFEFKIAVISKEDSTFFPSAKQKHLVVAYNKNSEECHVIGYLTSKKTGVYISEKQFKVYQDDKLGITKENSNKPKDQYFKLSDNPEAIPKNDLIFILEGNNYIKDTAIEYFEDLRTKLKQLPSCIFNPNEFTKEDGINLCQAFDKNITDKKSQPKSKDQIKLDQEHQLKQKEINDEKKLKAAMSQQETTTLENHEDKTK
jgi:hypothetical protein